MSHGVLILLLFASFCFFSPRGEAADVRPAIVDRVVAAYQAMSSKLPSGALDVQTRALVIQVLIQTPELAALDITYEEFLAAREKIGVPETLKPLSASDFATLKRIGKSRPGSSAKTSAPKSASGPRFGFETEFAFDPRGRSGIELRFPAEKFPKFDDRLKEGGTKYNFDPKKFGWDEPATKVSAPDQIFDLLRTELQKKATKAPAVTLSLPAFADQTFVFENGVMVNGEKAKASLSFDMNTVGEQNLDAAMRLIAATPSGKKLLAKILPLWERGEIVVKPLLPSQRDKDSHFAAGLCDFGFEPGEPTAVSADFSDVPSILAASLFHEFTHAASEEEKAERKRLSAEIAGLTAERDLIVAAEASRRGVQAEKISYAGITSVEAVELNRRTDELRLRLQRNTFRFERVAHDAHLNFLTELATVFPTIVPVFDYLEQEKLQMRKLSDDKLIEDYKLTALRKSVHLCPFAKFLPPPAS